MHAVVLLVTHGAGSPPAQAADVTLMSPVGESNQLMGNLFEQSALVLLNAVAIEIASHEPEARAGMAQRHTNML